MCSKQQERKNWKLKSDKRLKQNRTCHTFHVNKYTRIHTSKSYFSPLLIHLDGPHFGAVNQIHDFIWQHIVLPFQLLCILNCFFFYSLSLFCCISESIDGFPPSLICPLIFILNLFSAWIVHYYTSIKLDNHKWQQQQEESLGTSWKMGNGNKIKKKKQQREERRRKHTPHEPPPHTSRVVVGSTVRIYMYSK